jgi:hypothetical protein
VSISDRWTWPILVLAAAGALVGLCRLLGLGRKRTGICLCVAAGGTVAVAGSLLVVHFAECTARSEPPRAWPWSPRVQFCEKDAVAPLYGALALLAVPTLLVALGAILWAWRGEGWATLAFGLLLATPLLPVLYLGALPNYPVETTPILHNPYLRVATDARPARACYVNGIIEGPDRTTVTDETERICVDLEPTAEARALTPDDELTTTHRLDMLGKKLTENGREADTEFDGLVVARVYPLSGAAAREDSTLIPTVG